MAIRTTLIQGILDNPSPSISFEVFPPKAESSFQSVVDAIHEIACLRPSFMSITYGAGGGTSKFTFDIAKKMENEYGVPTLAHLTCVSSSKESVYEIIKNIKEAGIRNIMALRGDIPKDRLNEDRSSWDYQHAIDLIYQLKAEIPDLCVGAACYPEIHPESPSQKDDIARLKEKVEAGCDFLTTQMFFDNDILYNFLYKIREAGITVPVLPGIMPITNAKQLARALTISGSHIPQRFKRLVDKFGSDPLAMKQAGIIYASDQIIDLYSNGISNVHVYTMNKPDVATAIKSNLSSILGRTI